MMHRLLCVICCCFAVTTFAKEPPIRAENQCPQSMALVFSPAFVLCLPPPLSAYENSAIVSVDGLVLKFADGKHFYGQVLMPASEGFPDNFDMRLFPEYITGIRAIGDVPQAVSDRLLGLLSFYTERSQGRAPEKIDSGTKTIYILEGRSATEAYITDATLQHQILLMGFQGIGKSQVLDIVKGVK